MALQPWREIAKPHRDVLAGTFQQAEFAADIAQVRAGTASAEYGDAESFFSRTYITEGMRLLLISVAQRLAGHGGDPVIQLQTAFGGGKTHTLLAVYHLASREVSTDRLAGVSPVLDEAGVQSLPYARIAVLDGNNLSPSQPATREGCTIRTLWGELAWQLIGPEGFEQVAESDVHGTSPGKEVLIKVLRQAAPCVILVDELLAFIRQLSAGHQYAAGTYDSNLSFIQALTEAVKSVPNAVLLASLPESELEVGGPHGGQALAALEKYFARVESVWKPLAAQEAFEVVRRRLFETTGEEAAIDQICKAYFEYYRQHQDKLPQEVQQEAYRQRLRQTYPIHPEIFDRLYEDWSTLEKFQRTRGVLQLMAVVIHRLWNDSDQNPLIMPGSLPLYDPTVRTKSIHYLPQGWEPVIEAEVDGRDAESYRIEREETRFGSVMAARRVARTIFLGSAPGSGGGGAGGQSARGLLTERILLGSAQPEQPIGLYEDALKRLQDRFQYLFADQHRVWLDIRPNLRREMEHRKSRLTDAEANKAFLKKQVEKVFGRSHSFAGIHVFTPSSDVPDEYGAGPRLVVLPPDAAYSRQETTFATEAAQKILRNRGDQPRQKQNRLVFLAPDRDVVARLRDQAKTYRAWAAILDDFENERVVYDNTQLRQTRQAVTDADKALSQIIREAYKWLLAPCEEFRRGQLSLQWEAVTVATGSANLVQEIERKLREEDWVIYEWSPIHLRQLLYDWYFTQDQCEVFAAKVWRDTCHYLYMPRLLNDQVFKDAISRGVVTGDYFAFAAGKEGERYLGFLFEESGLIDLGEESLLVDRDHAVAYKIQQQPSSPEDPASHREGKSSVNPGQEISPDNTPQPEVVPDRDPKKKHFYGTVHLDPVKAKMEFSQVMDEVVQHFTSQPGVKVTISVEVEAETASGFGEQVQRAVKENSSTLGFSSSEFEEG